MAHVSAFFEVAIDPVSRLPILPRDADGNLTLFDDVPVEGWTHACNMVNTPATMTLIIRTSEAQMAAHKADTSILFLADCNSPVKDESVNAQGAKAIADWLKAHGYSGAQFGQTLSAIQSQRTRRAIVDAVAKLHGAAIEHAERIRIGL